MLEFRKILSRSHRSEKSFVDFVYSLTRYVFSGSSIVFKKEEKDNKYGNPERILQNNIAQSVFANCSSCTMFSELNCDFSYADAILSGKFVEIDKRNGIIVSFVAPQSSLTEMDRLVGAAFEDGTLAKVEQGHTAQCAYNSLADAPIIGPGDLGALLEDDVTPTGRSRVGSVLNQSIIWKLSGQKAG